jgi:hypothetical protein
MVSPNPGLRARQAGLRIRERAAPAAVTRNQQASSQPFPRASASVADTCNGRPNSGGAGIEPTHFPDTSIGAAFGPVVRANVTSSGERRNVRACYLRRVSWMTPARMVHRRHAFQTQWCTPDYAASCALIPPKLGRSLRALNRQPLPDHGITGSPKVSRTPPIWPACVDRRAVDARPSLRASPKAHLAPSEDAYRTSISVADVDCGVEQSHRGASREDVAEGLEQAAILTVRHMPDRRGLSLTAVLTLGTPIRKGRPG